MMWFRAKRMGTPQACRAGCSGSLTRTIVSGEEWVATQASEAAMRSQDGVPAALPFVAAPMKARNSKL
jgi:uridine phosphorylase